MEMLKVGREQLTALTSVEFQLLIGSTCSHQFELSEAIFQFFGFLELDSELKQCSSLFSSFNGNWFFLPTWMWLKADPAAAISCGTSDCAAACRCS